MLPFSIRTFMSLTQAPSTLRSVEVARATPSLMAASRLSGLVALISVTRATLMNPPSLLDGYFPFDTAIYPGNGGNKRAETASRLEPGREHGLGGRLRRAPFRFEADRYGVGPGHRVLDDDRDRALS